MITVETWSKPEDFISKFRITGHAEAEDEQLGYDLVCASVSSIALTAAFGIKNVLHKQGVYKSDSGYLLVDLGKESDSYTEVIIQTMLNGLTEVQKQFPERIIMKNHRR